MRPVRIRGTIRNDFCGRIYKRSFWHGSWCCCDEQL